VATIHCWFNKTEDYILAIVGFLEGGGHRVHDVRRPFRREPDFGVTSGNYDLGELLARAEVRGWGLPFAA